MMSERNRDEMDRLLEVAAPFVAVSADEAPDVTLSPLKRDAIPRTILRRSVRSGRGVRVALAATLAVAIACAGALSVQAVRESLYDAIVGWYADYITVRIPVRDPSLLTGGAADYRWPQIEGMQSSIVDFDEGGLIVSYTRGEKRLTYRQTPLDGSTLWLNTDDGIETVTVSPDSPPVYIARSASTVSLVWHDGAYRYLLTGNLPMGELVKIAEKIGR